MVILYEVHNGLYVNMTNRCPCACTFCLRQNRDSMDGSGSLWLEREPTVDEIKTEFAKFDMTKYSELVFCGFGEPTERLYDLLLVAEFVKENYDIPIRINTNGLGDLINGTDTAPLYEGKIDVVSISLNTPNPQKYSELTRPKFGDGSFEAMLKFAGNVKNYVPEVVLTTVSTTLTPDEEEQCRKICEDLGVTYRIRPFEDENGIVDDKKPRKKIILLSTVMLAVSFILFSWLGVQLSEINKLSQMANPTENTSQLSEPQETEAPTADDEVTLETASPEPTEETITFR